MSVGPNRRASREATATPTENRGGLGQVGRRERTAARLLEAAREVFLAKGLRDTTIDDIVSVAGVSHGSFYVYFSNKEQAFEQVVSPLLDRLYITMSARAHGGTIFSRLEGTNRAFLALWASEPQLMQRVMEAARSGEGMAEQVEAMRLRFIQRTADHLRRHQAGGVGHDVDPELAAQALSGMLESYAGRRFRRQESVDELGLVEMSYSLSLLWYNAVYNSSAPSVPPFEDYVATLVGRHRQETAPDN